MNLSARFGGEEFLTVLLDGDIAGAVRFAERVVAETRALRLASGPLTASAGVATYEEGMGSHEVLVATADRALYAAKGDGRHRVARAERFATAAGVGAGAEASGRPEGSLMTVAFELECQEFLALNGGPQFSFSPAISFVVNCETQAEVDELWEKLSAGGEKGQCGWLKDRFGMSWQIIPTALGKLMGDPDPAKSQRVMQAMLQMTKIDIAELQRAYDQA